MADIGLSAFSLFFMQSESFLSYQRSLDEGRKTSNSMLDPVHPSHLQASFDQAFATLRGHGGMKAFRRLDGRTPVAFDGTEYFGSQKLGRPHCQTRKRSNGNIEFYHSMLAAAIVAPGSQQGLAPDAGVHRQAGWRRKAGLRAQRCQTLACGVNPRHRVIPPTSDETMT